MSRLFVHGLGAVSPAGWNVAALCAALKNGSEIATQSLPRPGWDKPVPVRAVPPPVVRPPFLAHPRLRRSTMVAQHTVAAALEALGDDLAAVQSGKLRLGVVVCVMDGCVTYSRRFYEEIMADPSVASPVIFPETVFNAPASHLAAYVGTNAINYTLVGDEGTFLQGLALAAGWLLEDRADAVVVVGAEEMDWIVANAMRLFQSKAIHSHGAGALYLKKDPRPAPGTELALVTDPFIYTKNQTRDEAARKMRSQLPVCGPEELLCCSTHGAVRSDKAETEAWHDWSSARLEPKAILGEGLTAVAAWQCVAACDAIQNGGFKAANVSVVGANQQAIGARFKKSEEAAK